MKHSMHRARSRAGCQVRAYRLKPNIGEAVSTVHLPERMANLRLCLEGSGSSDYSMFDADMSHARATHVRAASRLRIAMPAILAHTLIAPALPRFLEQHRDLSVQLLITEQGSEPDRCDAAICIRPPDLVPRWSARCLAVMPETLCASDGFLSVYGTPHGPHELNPAHCMGTLDADSRPRAWAFQHGSTEVTVVPAAPLMFSDAQSAVAAAVRGGGFVLVPQLAVESQISAGLLRPLLLEWNAPRCAIWMKHAGPLTPQLKTFVDFVAGLLPSEAADAIA
jgi:DNA-binding transcriptional LysR family regulator